MYSNKPMFWVIVTLLAEMFVIAVFVPSSFLKKIAAMEYGWMKASYSESTMNWLDQETDEWHYTLTRETGLADGMRWMFFPTEESQAKEKGMSRFGQNFWFPFLESRGRALDEMLKTTLMRIGSIIIWLPLLLLIAIPAFFDGLMERRIKQHTFKYASPFVYRYGIRSTFILSFIVFFCMFTPIPIPPMVLPVSVMAAIAVMGLLVVGNLPKRI